MTHPETDPPTLPAPRWWQVPEQMACLLLPTMAIFGWIVFRLEAGDGQVMGLVPMVAVFMLMGLHLKQLGSYSPPDASHKAYASLYLGLYFGLLMATMQTGNGTWRAFVVIFLIAGLFFGGFMYIVTKQRPARYDWSLVYDGPYVLQGIDHAAKLARSWLAIVCVAVFAALTLTRDPAWAILTGASLLAFTPPAYARNPATARPVLARVLNLIALCLSAAAAYLLLST